MFPCTRCGRCRSCVAVLNITPNRCCEDPGPPEPKLSLPGLDLASATSSCAVFAGDEAGTTRKLGTVYTSATGAKSLIGSNPQLVVEMRIDRVRRKRRHEQRVPIGLLVRRHRRADVAGRTRPVVDDDRLAQPLRQRVGDHARRRVDATARRPRHDQLDGLASGKSARGQPCDSPRHREPAPDARPTLRGGDAVLARSCSYRRRRFGRARSSFRSLLWPASSRRPGVRRWRRSRMLDEPGCCATHN